MFGARNSKREEADDRIAVGYMVMSLLSAGKAMDVGVPMKAAVSGWDYTWGGLYVDHSTSNDTVAAIGRAATFNRAITLVVVPTEAHLPRGRRAIATGHGSIPVVTADSDEPAADAQTQERGA